MGFVLTHRRIHKREGTADRQYGQRRAAGRIASAHSGHGTRPSWSTRRSPRFASSSARRCHSPRRIRSRIASPYTPAIAPVPTTPPKRSQGSIIQSPYHVAPPNEHRCAAAPRLTSTLQVPERRLHQRGVRQHAHGTTNAGAAAERTSPPLGWSVYVTMTVYRTPGRCATDPCPE